MADSYTVRQQSARKKNENSEYMRQIRQADLESNPRSSEIEFDIVLFDASAAY